MKPFAFVSFSAHMGGLPSLGANAPGACAIEDIRLSIALLRAQAAAVLKQDAARAAVPPSAAPTDAAPAAKTQRRRYGRAAARPVIRQRPRTMTVTMSAKAPRAA